MRKLFGGLAAVAVVAGALSLAPPAQAVASPAAPTYIPPPIVFGQCTSLTLQRFGAECGLLTVPLDYAQPGRQEDQARRLPGEAQAPDAESQGVMLVNPGGPGGSGLVYSIFRSFVPERRRRCLRLDRLRPSRRRRQQPSLSCDGDYGGYNRPDYVPVNAQLEQTWRSRADGVCRGLRRRRRRAARPHEDRRLRRRTWTASARRSAQQQINYYGFSYGTYLGQVYATLYPEPAAPVRVRRRRRPAAGLVRGQPRPGRRVRPQHQDLLRLGREVRQRLPPRQLPARPSRSSTTASATSSAPHPAPAARSARRVDRHLPAGGLLRLRLGRRRGRVLGVGQRRRRRRRSRTLYDGANRQGPGDDNGYAIYLAVQCTDAPWPQQLERRAHRQLGRLREGAVRDVGQRLVQRAVPDLGGASPASRSRSTGARRRRSC